MMTPEEEVTLWAALNAREERIWAVRRSHNEWLQDSKLSEWPNLFTERLGCLATLPKPRLVTSSSRFTWRAGRWINAVSPTGWFMNRYQLAVAKKFGTPNAIPRIGAMSDEEVCGFRGFDLSKVALVTPHPLLVKVDERHTKEPQW